MDDSAFPHRGSSSAVTGEDEWMEQSTRGVGLCKEISAGLEPYEAKVSRTVLRGRWHSNVLLLPGDRIFL